MEKYIVVKNFRDRSDNLHMYSEGEEYPYESAPQPAVKRIKFLQSNGYIRLDGKEKTHGKKL